MSYGFRLLFTTTPGQVIAGSEPELALGVVDPPQRISLRKLERRSNETAASPWRYEVHGSGFETEEVAREWGERLRAALMRWGVRERVGVDVARDRIGTSSSRAAKKERLERTGEQLRDVIYGLDVFSEDHPVVYSELSISATTRRDIQGFNESIMAELATSAAYGPKVRLGLDLYNLTLYEPSSQNRFLALIMVLEAVVERQPRAAVLLRAIDACTKLIGGIDDLTADDKKTLRSGLGNLKQESITQACVALVAGRVGVSAGELVAKCYKARGELVHTGETHFNIAGALDELDGVVRKTLLALAGTTPSA